ncbi:MAG: hypothetical protein K8T26_11085 [Lentisphaerae bacterium]|nr:hypothetical protein [Lentisphaerota bacterium]
MKETLLSNSITKKGPTVYAWAIAHDRDACPFATPLCQRWCYARSGQFPLHWRRYREHHALTRSDEFVPAMVREIERAADRRRGETVSICVHERGDFDSLQYLGKWAEIIRATDGINGVNYYLYTRAWVEPAYRRVLEAMAEWPNVRVNISVDRDNCETATPQRIGSGLVTWFAEDDADVPRCPADVCFRNLRMPKSGPRETVGGCLTCPYESGLYIEMRHGRPVLRKGRTIPVRCESCRLCIDRDLAGWSVVRQMFAGSPGEIPEAGVPMVQLDGPDGIIGIDSAPGGAQHEATTEEEKTMARTVELKAHPYTHMFPLTGEHENKELEEDIRDNGLKEAIWVHEGMIVDGRRRYRACLKVGVTPVLREWDGEGSLVKLIWSLNYSRRHLTPSQRAAVAALMKPMLSQEAKDRMRAGGRRSHGRAAEGMEIIPDPDRSERGAARDIAARMLDTNGHYVSDAGSFMERDPETFRKIHEGELSIPQAKRLAAATTESGCTGPSVTTGSDGACATRSGEQNESEDLCRVEFDFFGYKAKGPRITVPQAEALGRTFESHVAGEGAMTIVQSEGGAHYLSPRPLARMRVCLALAQAPSLPACVDCRRAEDLLTGVDVVVAAIDPQEWWIEVDSRRLNRASMDALIAEAREEIERKKTEPHQDVYQREIERHQRRIEALDAWKTASRTAVSRGNGAADPTTADASSVVATVTGGSAETGEASGVGVPFGQVEVVVSK